MKHTVKIATLFVLVLSLVSCFDEAKPNFQYMPNMYEPVVYNTYGENENIFENGQTALLPAEGSIARGWQPYDYNDTPDELVRAKAELFNPLTVTQENLDKGKELYDIYCAVCHGTKGDGQGILMQREKILGIPSYADPNRVITEGGVYHVMMYGLNSMGSYASQTNEEERWQITHHVMNLKAELLGEPLMTPLEDMPTNLADMAGDAEAGPEGEGTMETEEENNL